MSDILTYKPEVEWNNKIVNFGMPTASGNLRLTEICLNSQDCLTATKGAMELSFTDQNFELARTPPVLKIVRTLFGAETGLEIETAAAVYETHDIETYVPGVGPFLADVDWLINIDKDLDLAIKKTSDLSDNRKDVWNPRGLTIATGNRSITGNWDTDGEPYVTITWNAINAQYCSDGTSTNSTDCLNHAFDGYCRTPENRTESVVSGTHTGGEVVPYDSTDLIRQTTNQYCLQGQYSPSYGGRCHYSNNNGQSWNWYGSNWTKQTCLEYTQTVGGWNYLWWYWSDAGNTWTSIYHNWFPSTETTSSWKEFKVLTAASHRIWPKEHMATTASTVTIYHGDVNTSYGNGVSVGRAYWPMWIANVFDWPDYDNMYAAPIDIYVCSDQTYHCVDPAFTDEATCIAGSSVWELLYPDEVSCLAGGFTWDFSHTEPTGATVIPTKEVMIPIDDDYYQKVSFGYHTFVNNQTGSRPTGQYGYTGNNTEVYASKVRWFPPMYNYSNWQHTYMRPTKFRIYRSPWHSPNGLSLTGSDYEADIWKLAGEVPCVNETGYHYFYDSRENMFAEGLDAYQYAYYGMTAVWEGWNWKRGFTVQRYNNMSNFDWDVYTDSNSNIDAFEGLTPNDTWETNIINISDNTNYRTHRISGYMKAPYTGNYRFWINSDDAMYVWTGSTGETVESILTWRTWYNAMVDEPGNHGARSEYSAYFSLNEGDVIPILMYHGQSWGGMTLQFQIEYQSGTWDNGLSNTGGWHYKPIYMMPQSGNPNGLCSDVQYFDSAQCTANSGTWTDPIGDGQTVEGHWTSSNVSSNYKN